MFREAEKEGFVAGHLARVRATFMRRASARNPTLPPPPALARTQEKMTTSASRPCIHVMQRL